MTNAVTEGHLRSVICIAPISKFFPRARTVLDNGLKVDPKWLYEQVSRRP